MRRHCWFLVAALTMQLASIPFAKAGMQTVHFKATSEDEFTRTKKIELSAWLMKPEGAGPFPAIVLLHECEPWSKQRFHQWGDLFVKWGYVVLAPDSLAPRGLKEVCPKYSAAQKFRRKRNYAYQKLAPRAGPNLRVYDMLDAVRFLAKLPYVDPKKIHIAGWGHGGETAMQSAFQSDGRRFLPSRWH